MSDVAHPRSPFSIEPVLRDGSPIAIGHRDLRDTSCYIAILKALARHRFLSLDYLAALTGFTHEQVKRCVRVMRATPNRLIKISDHQADPEHRRGLLVTRLQFEPDDAGIKTLAVKGIALPPRDPIKFLAHQVLVDQVMASFEIGAAKHADTVQIISRAQILASDKTPQQTRDSDAPENMRVEPDSDGTRRRMTPDGELFALSTASGFRFFGGIEANTGTMNLRRKTLGKSIEGKLHNYFYILKHHIYAERFNSNTYFVPFITPYRSDMNTTLEMWEDITKRDRWMRPCLPMKVHPLFDGLEKPRPTGHMLEEKWAVAGGDTLDLLN